MKTQFNDSHWPSQLREVHKEFEGIPEKLLQDYLNKIQKLLKPVIKRYNQAIETFLHQITEVKNNDKEQGLPSSSIGTFLEAVDSYLANIPELPIDQIAGEIFGEIRTAALSTPEAQNIFSKDLDYQFWKSLHVDTFAQKTRKFISLNKFKIKGILFRKGKSTAGFYGRQNFQVDLFFQYYYVLPIMEKIFGLTNDFLHLYAKDFNILHSTNEKLIRNIIAAEQSHLDDTESLKPQLKSYIDAHLAELSDNYFLKEKHANVFDDLLERLSIKNTEQLTVLDDLFIKAGTDFLPETQFTRELLENRYKEIDKLLKEHNNQWNLFFEGEKVDWVKDMDLLKFNHLSIEIYRNANAQITSRISNKVLPELKLASEAIESSMKLFLEQTTGSDEALKESILKESRSTFRKLRREIIPQVIELLSNAAIPKILSNVLSQLKYKIGAFDDEYMILQHANLEKIPPRIKLQEISLKKIIETEYFSSFSEDFQNMSDEAEQFLTMQFRTLNEIGQIIEFNIETALELIDDAKQKKSNTHVHLLVSEGLERANEILTNVYKELEITPLQWSQKIAGMIIGLNDGVIELIDNQKISILQLREARAEASMKYKGFRSNLFKALNLLMKEVLYWLSFGLTGAKSGYRQISRITGKLSLPEYEKELMNLLYTTGQRIEKLPYIYQRLYRFEPLIDLTLFGGREKELKVIDDNYMQWKSGNFANTMIIGEKGSGRTSLLNLAGKAGGVTNPIIQVNLNKNIKSEDDLLSFLSHALKQNEISSFEQLHDRINELETPVVCIVEDLHLLFLRTLDGIDIIERFLWLISQTHKNVFWIVSIGSYCWNFLDATISINRYFHHMIYLSQIELPQIREIILKRHRISGYSLEFLPDETDLKDRRYKNLRTVDAQQAFLDNEFFKELHSITRGNISVAFMLWQLSVEEFKKEKVIIRRNLKMETGFISDLPEDEIFTLEALLEHEIMTIEEHALVFKESEERSSQILHRMKNKGLLVETQLGFQIHYILYKPIVRAMDSKNILK